MGFFSRNKKKQEKNQTREYVDGKQTPTQIPPLEIPIPPPELPTQPTDINLMMQPQSSQLPPHDCPVCIDFGFYADSMNVWHHCPRCNPKPTQSMAKSSTLKAKPLHEIRSCENCGAKNEVHKKKKAFTCGNCGEAST